MMNKVELDGMVLTDEILLQFLIKEITTILNCNVLRIIDKLKQSNVVYPNIKNHTLLQV